MVVARMACTLVPAGPRRRDTDSESFVAASAMDHWGDLLGGELDVDDLQLDLQGPADLGRILVHQPAAGPSADADRRRAPLGVSPLDHPERAAWRRRDVPEGICELLVRSAKQADHGR